MFQMHNMYFFSYWLESKTGGFFFVLFCFTKLCLINRVKKLRETLVAVQQLDKNMSSLRSWLAHIETELSRPIVYETCDDAEIQRKLHQQQVGTAVHRQSCDVGKDKWEHLCRSFFL